MEVQERVTYIYLLHIALLKDLDDGILFTLAAELILECSFRGGIKLALCTLPCRPVSIGLRRPDELDLLVCDEDLEAVDNLCKRNTSVTLPLLKICRRLEKDDEVFLSTLVVDLSDTCFSGRHLDVCDCSIELS